MYTTLQKIIEQLNFNSIDADRKSQIQILANYIQKKMAGNACKVTTIARGIAFGGELEYADEMTLGKSISNRQPIQQYIK